MIVQKNIAGKNIEIELHWIPENLIAWTATADGARISSGITGDDDYGNLIVALPEIEEMVEIDLEIASLCPHGEIRLNQYQAQTVREYADAAARALALTAGGARDRGATAGHESAFLAGYRESKLRLLLCTLHRYDLGPDPDDPGLEETEEELCPHGEDQAGLTMLEVAE